MILYGCAVTDGDVFARCAEAGVRRLTDAGGELLAQPSVGSVARNYNLLRDRAAEHPDLEALVLLHQDVEIVDPRFAQTVRETLADPEVAIVGCAGAIGVRGLAWWEGSITWASVTQRYEEFGGGGEIPGISWRPDDERRGYVGTGEVDAIDGCLIVLSPWAVRNLGFDEQLARRHGYDVDICLQARAAGRKAVTADLRVVHHHSLDLLPDTEAWIQAHIALAEKWEGRLGIGAEGDWRRRALRAEAEASAYRLRMGAAELQRDDARGKLLDTWRSPSWTWTEPVRRLGARIRRSR
jgi:GT2 family glycosyltransferase